MNRLLELIGVLFGERTRRNIFEPLIGDWQREWRDASRSPRARIRIAVSGSTALVFTAVTCLITGGFAVTQSALMKGLLTLAMSSFALLALQIALLSQQASPEFGIEPRIWMSLSRLLPLMIPLAILPTMMLWRGVGLNHRIAIGTTVVMSLSTVVVVGWLVPKTQGDVPIAALSDRWQEQMHQRLLANDAAARYTYPGSAARALRTSTPEQRAAARQRWRNHPRYIAARAEQMRARWNAWTFSAGGLTIALAALGWALGGVGRTRLLHAAAWWALTCLTLIVFNGQLVFWINSAQLRAVRATWWAPLAVFGTAAVILRLGTRRHQTSARGESSSEVHQ